MKLTLYFNTVTDPISTSTVSCTGGIHLVFIKSCICNCCLNQFFLPLLLLFTRALRWWLNALHPCWLLWCSVRTGQCTTYLCHPFLHPFSPVLNPATAFRNLHILNMMISCPLLFDRMSCLIQCYCISQASFISQCMYSVWSEWVWIQWHDTHLENLNYREEDCTWIIS